MELPPEPARFTDWSSISSPPATFPHGTPGISAEPSENVPNQLNVPEDQAMQARPAIPIDTGPQSNNVEQNEESVDIIPPVPMNSAHLSLHAEDVVLVDTP